MYSYKSSSHSGSRLNLNTITLHCLVPECNLYAELHLDIVYLLEAPDVEVGVHHGHPGGAVQPLHTSNFTRTLNNCCRTPTLKKKCFL